MRILAIETSCDETAVAVVEDGVNVLTSLIGSQIELHAPYGGVVPEVACRAHAEWLPPLIQQALEQAGCPGGRGLDAIAATSQPGLIGALLVGLTAGKALAWSLDLPFLAVDHINGHIHAPRMVHSDLPWPQLALVVSGGHTEVYRCDSPLHREVVSATTDDAAGECFDKAAALLGLGYPGGPAIERAAKAGNRKAIRFPRGQGLSFSGLKTAVLHELRRSGYMPQGGRPRLARGNGQGQTQDVRLPTPAEVSDFAASFQEAVVDMLVKSASDAVAQTGIDCVTLTGGVACNGRLRERLMEEGAKVGYRVAIAPKELCTDNAAMIAGAAYALMAAGLQSSLTVEAVPN